MSIGAHKGHSAEKRVRIDRAREHYETRRDRRPRQTWVEARGEEFEEVYYVPVRSAHEAL